MSVLRIWAGRSTYDQCISFGSYRFETEKAFACLDSLVTSESVMVKEIHRSLVLANKAYLSVQNKFESKLLPGGIETDRDYSLTKSWREFLGITEIKRIRIPYEGYVQWIMDNRAVKTIFIGNQGGRRRTRGRPRKAWIEFVEEDRHLLESRAVAQTCGDEWCWAL